MKRTGKQIAISVLTILLAAIPMRAHAAEPLYPQEELEYAEEDGVITFTMPVYVYAKDHSRNPDEGSSKKPDDPGKGKSKKPGDDDPGKGKSQGDSDPGRDPGTGRSGRDTEPSVNPGTGRTPAPTKEQPGTGSTSGAGSSKPGTGRSASSRASTAGTGNSGSSSQASSAASTTASTTTGSRTPVGYGSGSGASNTAATEPAQTADPTTDEPREAKKGFIIPKPLLIGLLIALPLAALLLILGLKGLLPVIWLMLMNRLLAKRRPEWHGMLTKDENRFVEVIKEKDASEETLQEIIDREKTPVAILDTAMKTGVITSLPVGTKLSVIYTETVSKKPGEEAKPDDKKAPETLQVQETLAAEEAVLYEYLNKLTGKDEVIATLYNDPAQMEITLIFHL